MSFFYIETQFQGAPLLVQKPFRTMEEAEQAAQRETTAGVYRILEFPSRDKRFVYSQWKQQQLNNPMPQSPYS